MVRLNPRSLTRPYPDARSWRPPWRPFRERDRDHGARYPRAWQWR